MIKYYFFLFFSTHLWAYVAPFYGTEFTFTNTEIANQSDDTTVNSAASVLYQNKWRDLMIEKCKETVELKLEVTCTVKRTSNRYKTAVYKVQYSDGFWFQINTDPKVIETQMKPISRQEANKLRNRIQRDLFDTAAAVGLFPHEDYGGGHIHIDLQSGFRDNSLLFRNFLVYVSNHPTLSVVTLDNDTYNSPPIALLPEENQKQFSDIIKEYDQDLNEKKWDLKELATNIVQRVYNKTCYDDFVPAEKYQMLNLNRIVSKYLPLNKKTVEFRGFRAQNSMDQFLAQVDLLESILNYLDGMNSSIPLKYEKMDMDTDLTSRSIKEFRHFIEPLNPSIFEYYNLLPASLIKFINGSEMFTEEIGQFHLEPLEEEKSLKRSLDELYSLSPIFDF